MTARSRATVLTVEDPSGSRTVDDTDRLYAHKALDPWLGLHVEQRRGGDLGGNVSTRTSGTQSCTRVEDHVSIATWACIWEMTRRVTAHLKS